MRSEIRLFNKPANALAAACLLAAVVLPAAQSASGSTFALTPLVAKAQGWLLQISIEQAVLPADGPPVSTGWLATDEPGARLVLSAHGGNGIHIDNLVSSAQLPVLASQGAPKVNNPALDAALVAVQSGAIFSIAAGPGITDSVSIAVLTDDGDGPVLTVLSGDRLHIHYDDLLARVGS